MKMKNEKKSVSDARSSARIRHLFFSLRFSLRLLRKKTAKNILFRLTHGGKMASLCFDFLHKKSESVEIRFSLHFVVCVTLYLLVC